MTTLALSYVGGFVGTAIAGPIGGLIGKAVGALGGSFIDNKIFGAPSAAQQIDPNRFKVTTSTEGRPIPRLYGRARVAGNVIWSTYFRREQAGGGGKGLGPAGAGEVDRYYANWAVALCEGPITRLGQIWADGKPMNAQQGQMKVSYRLYYGTEDQEPDSLIVAKEGAQNTPAFRGICYIVFENMDLEKFGNRLPQITAEVFRSLDDLETTIQAVTMIPAAGEFCYAPEKVTSYPGYGYSAMENVNNNSGVSDIGASLLDLSQTLPNASTISLFAAWFGDDLRAANCTVQPRVENDSKETDVVWSAGGLTRSTAQVVSQANGGPAYGGTPSDLAVFNAIILIRGIDEQAPWMVPILWWMNLLMGVDLEIFGKELVFTPFMLMDVAADNELPDPYTGETGQGAYPWRGRITKQYATEDETSAIASEVAAFVGTAQAADFSWNGSTVVYSGGDGWTYRRFILHYATLCAAAGGVEAFVIGSEMRGLTWLRSAAGVYPFVTALKQLAADVSAILPDAKIVYAADWSEWFGHQPDDGSGDVCFHLDPLWSDANIDAIGIDNYWPLADWRDGTAHLDYQAGYRDPRDPAYLRANVQAGEGYDWYYASDADRAGQIRTPITDGAYEKPWVFRYKDIKNWWLNQHYDRPGGTESGSPTAWVPQSKPVWFMELGCPAVDRGANQPNVFYDPKSSESAKPYFSRGNRDDLMQRAYLKALLGYFDPAHPDFAEAQNPVSTVYSERMVEPSRLFVYTWDARPYPAFPGLSSIWADCPNWYYGHWLCGRMGGAPISQMVARILDDAGLDNYDVGSLTGTAHGYLAERVDSPRAVIETLASAFFFDSVESGGQIAFRQRGLAGPIVAYNRDTLAEMQAGEPVYEINRAQETELPARVKVTYTDPNKSYQQGSADALRMRGGSNYVAEAMLPLVMDFDQATIVAQTMLHETWAARETLTAALPPSQLFAEPGDIVTVTDSGGIARDYRIDEVTIGAALQIRATSIEEHVYDGYDPAIVKPIAEPVVIYGQPVVAWLDLPLISGQETPYAGRVAAFANPWPGTVAFYRSPGESGYTLNVTAKTAAAIGQTTIDFYAGPVSRFDEGNVLQVRMANGQLVSVDDVALFGGANLAAIETAPGVWEIVQFGTVELVSEGLYNLSHFLRGQCGTEAAMGNPVAAGAAFVMLNAAIAEVAMTAAERGLPFNWKAGPASYDIGADAYITVQKAFNGVGLRPFSPCHIEGARDGPGNLTLAWVRRDRDPGADSWEQSEIPMSEASEAYEVDIMDGGTVKRTIAATSPGASYSAADQTTDFGAPQSSISVRVYQISQTFGRGSPGIATV